jgi:hypothetical protein
VPRDSPYLEGNTAEREKGECEAGSARSETPSMCGNILSENRESRSSPAKGSAGRVGKSEDERR